MHLGGVRVGRDHQRRTRHGGVMRREKYPGEFQRGSGVKRGIGPGRERRVLDPGLS